MEPSPSLRPVGGTPAEVQRLLRDWLAADDPPALTIRTSGSTGQPKEVALSRRAILASATATLERLGGPGQWVLALPAHYVAGLQVIVRSLIAGNTPVALDDMGGSIAAAAEALGSGRRYLAIVPTQLHRMLARPHTAAALASFHAVLLGGSAAPDGLVERAQGAGVAVVTTYGMTETCGGCVYDGLALDGVRVRLDFDGRVLIAGDVLFDEYTGATEATAAVVRDGWLATPDLGRIGADGRLEVLGRLDDVLVSGGVNVPAGVVERALQQHPGIRQAAVVGAPDAEWGTRVVAVVVGDRPPSLEAIRDHVAEQFPRLWAPRQLVVVDELPMLTSGKVDRQALVRLLAASPAGTSAEGTVPTGRHG